MSSSPYTRLACASIAVFSLDAALEVFERLGFRRHGDVQVSPRGFALRWIELGGDEGPSIELLEPIGDSGPVAKFLEKRGPGVYQIRLHVKDLEATVAQLEAVGATVPVKRGVPGHPDLAWIHPSSSGGVLIELLEEQSGPV